jgi:hypothetical protein
MEVRTPDLQFGGKGLNSWSFHASKANQAFHLSGMDKLLSVLVGGGAVTASMAVEGSPGCPRQFFWFATVVCTYIWSVTHL